MSTIGPDAQQIIDRLAAHTWQRQRIDRSAVEVAITQHLTELGLPPQPFRWFANAQDGLAAARSAAESAARSAAESAARSAAWSAARSAAESAAESAAWLAARSAAKINALSRFNHPAQAKLVVIWLPMIDAFEAGLWLYWITPSEVICIEQPSLCIVGNRLHCENGPAVFWPNGESYYFWRGIQVPGKWIEDRANLDPAEVIRASNVEQRAAGAAICGWPKMLSVLKEKVVDTHPNPEVGSLIELSLPGLEQPGRFLKAQCPRNGTICEGVPYVSDIDGLPIESAIAAQAWRLGDAAAEFQISPKRT